MHLQPIEINQYYVTCKEKWAPFEVMRMRYEERLTHLTEEQVLTLRKTRARWFYRSKENETYLKADLSECDFGVGYDYHILLEDKEKVLVFKKPKAKKTVLTAIQKIQLLHKENALIRKTHRFYYAATCSNNVIQFAYLLLDKEGELLEKKYVREEIKPRYSRNFLLQVVEHLLERAALHEAKNLHIYTHHTENQKMINKLSGDGNGVKNEKNKNEYKEIHELFQLFDSFKYETIKKEKNKEARTHLHEIRTPIQKPRPVVVLIKTEEFHGYVDASASSHKKYASIAGVLKSVSGKTAIRYTKRVPYSPNTARLELIAVIEMMKRATQNGYVTGVIYTDNKSVYDSFQGHVKVRKRNRKVQQIIKNTKKEYPHFTVQHIPRKENQEAHKLAFDLKRVTRTKERKSEGVR